MSPSFCRNPEGDVPTPHIQYCSDDPPHNSRLSERVWISYSDVTVRSKDMAAVSTQVSTQVSTSTVSTRHVTVGQLRARGSWSVVKLVQLSVGPQLPGMRQGLSRLFLFRFEASKKQATNPISVITWITRIHPPRHGSGKTKNTCVLPCKNELPQ